MLNVKLEMDLLGDFIAGQGSDCVVVFRAPDCPVAAAIYIDAPENMTTMWAPADMGDDDIKAEALRRLHAIV